MAAAGMNHPSDLDLAGSDRAVAAIFAVDGIGLHMPVGERSGGSPLERHKSKSFRDNGVKRQSTRILARIFQR